MTAMRRLNDAGIACVVLSKGIDSQELATGSRDNDHTVTVAAVDERPRASTEPGAAPVAEGMVALPMLHEAGHATRVSMEPYPPPNVFEQDVTEALELVPLIDRIVFCRTNHGREASSHPNV